MFLGTEFNVIYLILEFYLIDQSMAFIILPVFSTNVIAEFNNVI